MSIDFSPYFAPDTGAATAESDADTGETDTDGETGTEDPAGDAPDPQSGDAAEQNWDINTMSQESELNKAMNDVGAGMPGEEDTADDETADQEGATDETEDETTADESEEDKETAEEDDATAEEEETGTEDEEATDEEEEQPEDEEDLEAEPLPEDVQELAEEHLPGHVVETKEQLDEKLESLTETAKVFDVVDRLYEQDERLSEYTELVLQEDMSPMEAAFRAFGELFEAPDPQQDPEAYADWKAEREVAERERAQDEQEEDELDEVAERYENQTAASFQRLAEKKDMSEEELNTFKKKVNTLVYGDPNGHVPSDQAERLYFALNKDAIIDQVREEALEEGRRQGRNEKIDDETSGQKGDGLPNPDKSGAAEETRTAEEEELAALGKQFEQTGATVEDFSL